jgi:hypothetical protein
MVHPECNQQAHHLISFLFARFGSCHFQATILLLVMQLAITAYLLFIFTITSSLTVASPAQSPRFGDVSLAAYEVACGTGGNTWPQC